MKSDTDICCMYSQLAEAALFSQYVYLQFDKMSLFRHMVNQLYAKVSFAVYSWETIKMTYENMIALMGILRL